MIILISALTKDSCFVGEDAASVDAHIKVLNDQHRTLHPDTALVKDRMTKTFAWRRREVAEGMCTVDLLKRYPFLGTSAGVRIVKMIGETANDFFVSKSDYYFLY